MNHLNKYKMIKGDQLQLQYEPLEPVQSGPSCNCIVEKPSLIESRKQPFYWKSKIHLLCLCLSSIGLNSIPICFASHLVVLSVGEEKLR